MANSNTGGNSYYTGSSVTVKGSTGNLVKTNHTFLGWAESSEAAAPNYAVNGTFSMGSANVELYAVWQENASSMQVLTVAILIINHLKKFRFAFSDMLILFCFN